MELGPRRFLTFYTRAPRLATRARRCVRLFPGPQKYSLLSRNPYEKDFLGPHNKSYYFGGPNRARRHAPGDPQGGEGLLALSGVRWRYDLSGEASASL